MDHRVCFGFDVQCGEDDYAGRMTMYAGTKLLSAFMVPSIDNPISKSPHSNGIPASFLRSLATLLLDKASVSGFAAAKNHSRDFK